jgi:hypothetical protein
MLGGVKNKAPVSRNHRVLAKSLVETPRRGSYQQHLLTPPLSQAFAARFSPLEPDVNKPRGSHIKGCRTSVERRIPVSGHEVSIDRTAASECIEMADRLVKEIVIQATHHSHHHHHSSSSIIMIAEPKPISLATRKA